MDDKQGEQYVLMVSFDCGISYSKQATGTIEELLELAEKEFEVFRWVIEDEDENPLVPCPIHRKILETFRRE